MGHGVLENIKRLYKEDLLLHLLNKEGERLNIAEFTMTLNALDAFLMCVKSCREVGESTIARSWNTLLCNPDLHQDDEDSETADKSGQHYTTHTQLSLLRLVYNLGFILYSYFLLFFSPSPQPTTQVLPVTRRKPSIAQQWSLWPHTALSAPRTSSCATHAAFP